MGVPGRDTSRQCLTWRRIELRLEGRYPGSVLGSETTIAKAGNRS